MTRELVPQFATILQQGRPAAVDETDEETRNWRARRNISRVFTEKPTPRYQKRPLARNTLVFLR